jgi:hypothetical protein
MHRHENPTDAKLREAEEHLAKILKQIKLTPLEKRYVNEATKTIVEACWNFF